MKAVLSSKGEVVIPGSLLKRYGLRAGATVVLEPREGEIVLRPDTVTPKARLVRQGHDVLLKGIVGCAGDDTGERETALGRLVMTWLLDVNFILASRWTTHPDHLAAKAWVDLVFGQV